MVKQTNNKISSAYTVIKLTLMGGIMFDVELCLIALPGVPMKEQTIKEKEDSPGAYLY